MAERVTLQMLAGELRGHVDGCARQSAATAIALTSLQKDMAEIKAMPMKAIRWLGTIIAGASAIVLAQNFMLNQQAVHTAQIAASQAQQTNAKVTQLLSQPKP